MPSIELIIMFLFGLGIFVASEMLAQNLDKGSGCDPLVLKFNRALGQVGAVFAAVCLTLTICLNEDDDRRPTMKKMGILILAMSLVICGLSIGIKIKMKGSCNVGNSSKIVWGLLGGSGGLILIAGLSMYLTREKSEAPASAFWS